MARRRNPSGFNLGKLKVKNTATNNKFFVGAKSNEQPLELNNNIYLAPGAPRNQGISRPFPNADVAEAYASLYSRYQRGVNTFPEFVALESIEGQDFEVSYFPSRESVDGYWRTRKYVGDTIVREVETTVKGSINYSQWQPPQLPIIPEFNYTINSNTPGFTQEVIFRGTDFQFEGNNGNGSLVIGGQTYDGYNWSFDSTTGNTNLTLVNNVELKGTQIDPLQLMGYSNGGSNYKPINAPPLTIDLPGGRQIDISSINWGNVTPELITNIIDNSYGFTIDQGLINGTYDLPLNGPQDLSTFPPNVISEPLDPIFFNTPGEVTGGGFVAGTYQCDGQAVLDFGSTSLDFDAVTVETVEHNSEIICSGTGCIIDQVYLPSKKAEAGADVEPEETNKPTVYLGLEPASIIPDGEAVFTYTFRRTGDTDRPLTVRYTIAGSAGSDDYSGASPGDKSIFIPTGEATKSIEIKPRVDNTIELFETIDVSIRESTRYYIGTTGVVSGTIQDYGDPSDPCYEFRRNSGELLKESQDIKEPYGLFIFPTSITETEEGPAITLGQVVGWNLRYSLETVEVGVETQPEDPPPPEETVPPEDAPSCTWYEATEAEYDALAIGSTISWSGIGNGEIVRGKSQLADGIYMILGCVE